MCDDAGVHVRLRDCLIDRVCDENEFAHGERLAATAQLAAGVRINEEAHRYSR